MLLHRRFRAAPPETRGLLNFSLRNGAPEPDDEGLRQWEPQSCSQSGRGSLQKWSDSPLFSGARDQKQPGVMRPGFRWVSSPLKWASGFGVLGVRKTAQRNLAEGASGD